MKENSFEQENIMQRVGFFRNKKNISASELSRSLGHRRNYIYRLEKCEIKLDLSTLQYQNFLVSIMPVMSRIRNLLKLLIN